MSAGSYIPPPVRTVAIPKKTGGERMLGIPRVADRVAQMVAKVYFEPMVEPQFHLNKILVRWARRKFKRLRYHLTKVVYWLGRIAQRQPELFLHWQVGVRPTVG